VGKGAFGQVSPAGAISRVRATVAGRYGSDSCM
jgi:hypothetical protein